MRKKARLIYNPVSGRELIDENLPELLDIYETAGYETSAFRTKDEPLSAQKEAERAAQDGFDLIIAAGGDGTVNEVVNGLVPLEDRPLVAVIPGGTSNDYAHALGISRTNIIDAAQAIYKDQVISMDIGLSRSQDNQRSFVNIAALGPMTELTYNVSSELKSSFGYLAYLAKAAEMLPTALNSDRVKVSFNDEVYEGDSSLIFVTLTDTFGGVSNVAPDTIPGDGKFTLIVVKTNNVVRIASLVRKLLNKGQHVNDGDIIYAKTPYVKVENVKGEEMPVNLDGDEGGTTPVEFFNLQQHINFVGNVEEMSSSIEPKNQETLALKKIFNKRINEYQRDQD